MTGMSQVNSEGITRNFVAMACVILLVEGSACKLASCSCSLYNSFGTFLRVKGCLPQSEWWNRAASPCGNHSVGHQANVSEQCLFLLVPVNGTIVGFNLALHWLTVIFLTSVYLLMTQEQSPKVFCNMLQQLPKNSLSENCLEFFLEAIKLES